MVSHQNRYKSQWCRVDHMYVVQMLCGLLFLSVAHDLCISLSLHKYRKLNIYLANITSHQINCECVHTSCRTNISQSANQMSNKQTNKVNKQAGTEINTRIICMQSPSKCATQSPLMLCQMLFSARPFKDHIGDLIQSFDFLLSFSFLNFSFRF